jgi:hypothetical protein
VIQASHVSTGTTNNALALNPSGGNVGVGTTTPGAKLHVATVDGSNTTPISFVNQNGYGIYANSGSVAARGNTLDFASYDYTAGAPVARNVMTLRPEGNVGINTTAPGTTLDVNGIARAISGFGTNSGFIVGLTTSGSIAHTFRGGIALLTAVGSSNVRYMGFVTWIGNISAPFIDQIVSVSLTASINTGTLAISFATTAGTANIAWNITYLSCPTWSPTTTFTPGF